MFSKSLLLSLGSKIICILVLVQSICTVTSFGQEVEFKSYLGSTAYLGDLAPLDNPLSFSEGNVAWSLGVGLKLSKLFTLHGRFTLGKLTGDDTNASNEGRKTRNLNFQSPLREIALITDFNLNSILKGLDKYGLQLYYTTGIALFQFEPYTTFSGELVKLRPLGTEGQGLPGRDAVYSNIQVSIPFGMGVSFNLSPAVKMGFEIVPRWTFTDYIDDVSGSYIQTSEFLDTGKPLTAALANRTGEFFGGSPIDYATGAGRGDPENNDWYVFIGFSVSYVIGAPPVEVPIDPLEIPAEEKE